MLNRLFACALCLTACGVEERPPPTRFVGTAEGSRALVFVVRDPGQTNAYACDGTRSPAMFEWFVNARSDEAQTLSSEGNTAQLDIDFATGTGTLTTDVPLALTFEPAEDGYGLYRGSKTAGDADYEIGIILRDDDTQNGVVGIMSGDGFTTVVSPAIERNQVAVTLLNDVRIPLEQALDAYAR